MRYRHCFAFALFSFGVVAEAQPTGSTSPPDVDAVLAEHTRDINRARDFAAYNITLRAELAYDALPDIGGFKSTLSASLIPYTLISGETVTQSVKRTLDEREGRTLGVLLDKTLASQLGGGSHKPLSSSEIESRYKVSERLRELAKKEKLLPEERKTLDDFWKRTVDANVDVALDGVHENAEALKDLADQQAETDAKLDQLVAQTEPLQRQIEDLDAKLQDIGRVDPNWMLASWNKMDFSSKVETLSNCGRSASDKAACDAIPADEQKRVMARERVRQAAATVEQIAGTYVGGSLQIAQNLGIPVPDWASEAVSGISSAAGIASGIVEGRPDEVIGGLIGLTGLFRKPTPSPEMLMLQKIDRRLDQIDQRLDKIEQTLDVIVSNQVQMMKSLDRIEARLDSIANLMIAVYAAVDSQSWDDFRTCRAAFFPADAIGPWRPFFRDRVQDGTEKPDQNQRLVGSCADFMVRRFAGSQTGRDGGDDTLLRRSSAVAKSGPSGAVAPGGTQAMNSEQIVAREGVLRQMLGHHHEVLGDADWPLLEPILLGDPSTRTDLVVRIARRSQIAWKEEGGAARLHDVGDLLDLDRLLMVAAIASTLKEENPQYRIYAEVVVNLQHLLRRYLMQRLLFDTDVSVALYAVKSLEGGVTPAQFQTAFTFLAGSDAARTDQLSATLVGDLFDASLWRSSPSARDFGVKRRAFQLAWRSSSLGAMRYEIGQLGGASDVTKNFVADFDGAGVLSLCLRDGVRTGYPGVTKWCISDEQFESRSNYRAPDDVQTVRFWVGVLGARESVRSGAGAGMGSGATNGSDFTPP